MFEFQVIKDEIVFLYSTKRLTHLGRKLPPFNTWRPCLIKYKLRHLTLASLLATLSRFFELKS
jgi:hypothetical protein